MHFTPWKAVCSEQQQRYNKMKTSAFTLVSKFVWFSYFTSLFMLSFSASCGVKWENRWKGQEKSMEVSFYANYWNEQCHCFIANKYSFFQFGPVEHGVDVIWIPTCSGEQLLEKFLVVDAGNTADLCYLGLSRRVSVDEVGCDSDSQLASQRLMLEA